MIKHSIFQYSDLYRTIWQWSRWVKTRWRDTFNAFSQTQNLRTQYVSIWRHIKNAHSCNETLQHKTSTSVITAHCTEFHSLPWNPIVTVPTRQTIIRAVSARRPHPCPVFSTPHCSPLAPPTVTKAGVLNWLQFAAHQLSLRLTVNVTCRRWVGVFGFTVQTRACTLRQTASY